MTVRATSVIPSLIPRHFKLDRLFAAVKARLARLGTARRRDSRDSSEVVNVGSVVRFFVYDEFREMTRTVAPEAWSGSTPGLVSADSPIGVALVGGRVGEMRQWESPSGPKRLRIVESGGHMILRADEPASEPFRPGFVPQSVAVSLLAAA